MTATTWIPTDGALRPRLLVNNSYGLVELCQLQVPGLPILYDGFESGDTAAWDATVP